MKTHQCCCNRFQAKLVATLIKLAVHLGLYLRQSDLANVFFLTHFAGHEKLFDKFLCSMYRLKSVTPRMP